MTKAKKLLVTLMIAFSFLCGGIVGVLMTNAEARNDLAVRYQYGKQTTAFLGESVKTAKATPIYPDKVKFVSYMVETPDGKTISVKNEAFTPETTGDYTVFVCVQGIDASTYVESYVVSVTKSEKPIMTQAPVLATFSEKTFGPKSGGSSCSFCAKLSYSPRRIKAKFWRSFVAAAAS